MLSAGILIEQPETTQAGFLIERALNDFGQFDAGVTWIVFYHQYGLWPIRPHFMMLQSIEAWSFPGPIIATSVFTADFLLNCLSPKKKFFYMWDLEWLYATDMQYDDYAKVYCHPDLHIIARHSAHQRIFSKVWNKSCTVIEDFNYEDIRQLL